MKTPTQQLKKTIMWYKVKELNSKGFNKSQISKAVGIDRATVRKYLSMIEVDFIAWISNPKRRPKKLQDYVHYIKKTLEEHPYLSSAQIEDRIKENFPDAPEVSSKTVYNTVQAIRREYDIKKSQSNHQRIYEKLPEVPYGWESQVDFGSYSMATKEGLRCKVYFFVMVLSRSRQKYLYFQDRPFTSGTTIDAHDQAFDYFAGQPKRILYDQDRVLVKDENLGDLILVQQFQQYISEMKFTPIFCRKSDPESKGKIENVVGYVKKNFLRGREYTDIESLNEAALSWLERTGNGKPHAGTKKVPHQEWLIEQNYLLPYYQQKKQSKELMRYKVRKDNTINYKSNFYSLPLGTYQGSNTYVLIKIEDNTLFILSDTKNQSLLTTHRLSHNRGETIHNTDHRREKSKSLEVLKAEVTKLYSDVSSYEQYTALIEADKTRYYRDNLLKLKSGRRNLEATAIEEAIKFCITHDKFNANTMLEVAHSYQIREQANKKNVRPNVEVITGEIINKDFTPQRSKISTYESIMK